MESFEITIGGKKIRIKSDDRIMLNKNKEIIEILYSDLFIQFQGNVDRESIFFIIFKLLDVQGSEQQFSFEIDHILKEIDYIYENIALQSSISLIGNVK
jgi:hypothetical protein